MPASTYIDRQKYPKCIIESNIKNGPIDNIIDQSYYPEATIGCYMYKSVCGSTPHTFSDHIRGFVEPNAGAHYYVQSATAVYTYKQSTYYGDAKQFTYKWNDPRFAIEWPIDGLILSERDS